MKLFLECDVVSNAFLPRRLELRKNGRVFIFELDPDKRWNKLRVVAPVPPGHQFKWGIELTPGPDATGETSSTLHGNPDPDLYRDVIDDIQALESTLSVFFPLHKIDWRHPTVDVEFEAGDDRDPNWANLFKLRVPPRTWPPQHIPEDHFVQIGFLALKADSLTIIQSFWREGEANMTDGNYIIGFFHFYFVLEGLYGDRKTKNYQIEQNFLASPDLMGFATEFMAEPHTDRNLKQIFDLFPPEAMKTIPDEAALIRLLISVRGRLHHFSNTPTRPSGTPLNREEYEGIALFARFLAHKSLISQLLQIEPGGFRQV